MSMLVAGAAGFIGVNLVAELMARGEKVIGLDNLCRGTRSNLERFDGEANFVFEEVDLHDLDALHAAVRRHGGASPITAVWHMAANSDIPAGIDDPGVDLRDTFMTTFNILAVMREQGIGTLAFASSSAVYGDLGSTVLTESSGPLFPISNYGAMKLASEALISAAVESWLDRAVLYRFPNVIGTPATHGVILDFVHKLAADPTCLRVLGDGTQQKCYLHVDELIEAMLHIMDRGPGPLDCFNIGSDDSGVTVRYIAETVRDLVAPSARMEFGKGNKGWIGDVPRFSYSIARLAELGWRPKLSSAEAIARAAKDIFAQEARRSAS